MGLSIKESKFGDIILWNNAKKKFVVVRNYYKLPNLLKTNNYEVCCVSLGNGSFVSFNETNGYITWYEATALAKVYSGSAPIKSYLPSIDELKTLYLLIEKFNRKIKKLKSLGIEWDEIKMWYYWSSMEYDSNGAYYLNTLNGNVRYDDKFSHSYVRAFVAF